MVKKIFTNDQLGTAEASPSVAKVLLTFAAQLQCHDGHWEYLERVLTCFLSTEAEVKARYPNIFRTMFSAPNVGESPTIFLGPTTQVKFVG